MNDERISIFYSGGSERGVSSNWEAVPKTWNLGQSYALPKPGPGRFRAGKMHMDDLGRSYNGMRRSLQPTIGPTKLTQIVAADYHLNDPGHGYAMRGCSTLQHKVSPPNVRTILGVSNPPLRLIKSFVAATADFNNLYHSKRISSYRGMLVTRENMDEAPSHSEQVTNYCFVP